MAKTKAIIPTVITLYHRNTQFASHRRFLAHAYQVAPYTYRTGSNSWNATVATQHGRSIRTPLQISSPLNKRAQPAPMSHLKYSATTSGNSACARRYSGYSNGGVCGPRGGYSQSPRRVASRSWCDAPAEKTAAAARLLCVKADVTRAFIDAKNGKGEVK